MERDMSAPRSFCWLRKVLLFRALCCFRIYGKETIPSSKHQRRKKFSIDFEPLSDFQLSISRALPLPNPLRAHFRKLLIRNLLETVPEGGKFFDIFKWFCALRGKAEELLRRNFPLWIVGRAREDQGLGEIEKCRQNRQTTENKIWQFRFSSFSSSPASSSP
jgi:hypothetical protein